MNFLTLLVDRQNEILLALREHLVLVFVPVGLAALVTIPLGILATRY